MAISAGQCSIFPAAKKPRLLIWHSLGVGDRAGFIAGDFFGSLPAAADSIILKSIIHDWNDARSCTILQNCRRSLPQTGTLLLVERLMPGVLAHDGGAQISRAERSQHDARSRRHGAHRSAIPRSAGRHGFPYKLDSSSRTIQRDRGEAGITARSFFLTRASPKKRGWPKTSPAMTKPKPNLPKDYSSFFGSFDIRSSRSCISFIC